MKTYFAKGRNAYENHRTTEKDAGHRDRLRPQHVLRNTPPGRFHADRTPGRHRHYRHFGQYAPTRLGSRQAKGPGYWLFEQHQAVGPGLADVFFGLQRPRRKQLWGR